MARRLSRQALETLAVLRLRGGETYGADLARATRMDSGAVAKTLRGFEARGWVEARWESGDRLGRFRRRYWRLTGEGERAAERELAAAREWLTPERTERSTA